MAKAKNPSTGQTISVIILLIVFWPIGLFLMFKWMKWSTVAQVLAAIATFFAAAIFWSMVSSALLVAINPVAQMKKAQEAVCTSQCQNSNDKATCLTECLNKLQNPSVTP